MSEFSVTELQNAINNAAEGSVIQIPQEPLLELLGSIKTYTHNAVEGSKTKLPSSVDFEQRLERARSNILKPIETDMATYLHQIVESSNISASKKLVSRANSLVAQGAPIPLSLFEKLVNLDVNIIEEASDRLAIAILQARMLLDLKRGQMDVMDIANCNDYNLSPSDPRHLDLLRVKLLDQFRLQQGAKSEDEQSNEAFIEIVKSKTGPFLVIGEPHYNDLAPTHPSDSRSSHLFLGKVFRPGSVRTTKTKWDLTHEFVTVSLGAIESYTVPELSPAENLLEIIVSNPQKIDFSSIRPA